ISDTGCNDETQVFTVYGATVATNTTETWVVDTNHTITWNVTHGDLATVKIIGSRSGTFEGASDTFLVTPSAVDADNIETFNAGNDPVSVGSYAWNPIDERSPSIISSLVKFKVVDGNVNLTSLTVTTPSDAMDITGGITITSPSLGDDWIVGDSDDASIDWTADGNIAYVDIEFNNGGSWIDVTDPATGTASGEGDKSFSVGNWLTYAEIPDTRTNIAQIKITDHSNSSVSATSATFWCYPTILTVAVSETPQIADTKPTVSWTYSPTSIMDEVAIWLDPNGDDDVSDGTALETGVDITSSPHETANKLPLALQGNARIRVRDNNSTFAGRAYFDTPSAFKIIGAIDIDEPTSTTEWRVGETNRAVEWTPYGNMGTVDINADYDGDGGGVSYVKISTPSPNYDESPWDWDPIPDEISDYVRIQIQDANATGDTSVESDTFKIVGLVDLLWPTGGQTVTKNDSTNIQWTKWGSIGTLKIEFFNGTQWTTLEETYGAGNDGETTSRGWSIPDKIITDAAIKITSNTYPGKSWATETSGDFTIQGGLTSIDPPDEDTVWKVGATETITWLANGTMSTVDIEFSSNGSTWSYVAENYSGTGLINGSNDCEWFIDESDPDFDVQSNNCFIKITSDQNPGVTVTSETFTVIPDIIVTTPAASWVAETKPTVSWTYTGSALGDIHIIIDRDWTGTWENETTVASSIDKDTEVPYTLTSNLSAVRSETTMMRVVDETDAWAYGESEESFKIIGEITLNQPDTDAEWEIGDSQNAVVDWAYKGDLDKVDIFYDYGSGWGNAIKTNANASDLKWTWDGSGVADHASTTVRVKVEATDARPDTFVISDTFDIIGTLTFTNVTGQVINIDKDDGHEMVIKWVATGSDIEEIKIDYSYDGQEANYSEIINSIDNDFTDGEQENQWTWPESGIPQDQATIAAKLRISAYVPLQLATQDISGAFSILGDIWIDEPDGGVEDVWISDGVTANVIRWQIAGDVVDVKILYAQDGVNYDYPIVSQTDADNETPGEWGTYHWTVPTDVTKDLLSNGICTIKIQDFTPAYATDVVATSPSFTVRGVLNITEPSVAQMNAGFACDASQQVTFERQGKIATADVLYSRNNGDSFGYSIDRVNFGAGASANTSWTVPEYTGHTNDADGYALRVEDISDTDCNYETQVFTVYGTTIATNTTETWAIDTNHTIT
ncbi:hypothetical protein ACFL0T_08625, partial [Candidatus Omnitrophota bacterium]